MKKNRIERNRGVGSTSSALSSVWKKIWDIRFQIPLKCSYGELVIRFFLQK
jgi:uncharacterized protein YicC (UPF0701 family)